MKIISLILIVAAAIPLGLNVTMAYIPDFKSAIQYDEHAIANLVSDKLTSEPAMMFFIGMGLITIAGIGRKNLMKKDNDLRKQKDFRSAIPPYPDPVPWKKE